MCRVCCGADDGETRDDEAVEGAAEDRVEGSVVARAPGPGDGEGEGREEAVEMLWGGEGREEHEDAATERLSWIWSPILSLSLTLPRTCPLSLNLPPLNLPRNPRGDWVLFSRGFIHWLLKFVASLQTSGSLCWARSPAKMPMKLKPNTKQGKERQAQIKVGAGRIHSFHAEVRWQPPEWRIVVLGAKFHGNAHTAE